MGFLLQEHSTSFLKGIDLVYIVGILSTVTGAVWAFYRFRFEKKLENFNTANSDLFTDDKQKKLSAIATLGVFRRDWMLGKNTTNVLLSKLYTETDYDITYAIGGALIEFSSRHELLRIANEIAGINRNFYSQDRPYQQRLDDIKKLSEDIHHMGENKVIPAGIDAEKDILEKRYTSYKNEYLTLKEKVSHDILWHEQITADTFARVIRGIGNKKSIPVIAVFKYIKQVLIDWNLKFLHGRFPLYIYQNAFSYIQLVDFKTSRCEIWRSSFSQSIIADVQFKKVNIYDCSFRSALLANCKLEKGSIGNCLMTNIAFSDVVFADIKFSKIYFAGGIFTDCDFQNCSGLTASSFFATDIKRNTKLPGIEMKDIEQLKVLDVIQEVLNEDLIATDKQEIITIYAKRIDKGEDLFSIYQAQISLTLKDDIVKEASANFRLNDVFLNPESGKNENFWNVLRLLSFKKELPELMVELFDSKLDNKTLKMFLSYIRPEQVLEDYQYAIKQSILNRSEKEEFLKQMDLIFQKPKNRERKQADH